MQEPNPGKRGQKPAEAKRDLSQVFPLAFLRTPICSYLRFLELCDTTALPKTLEQPPALAQTQAVTSFFQDPLVRRALRAKSASLYEALQRYEQGHAPLDDSAFTALYRYLARITTRCTPLMLFAGVGWTRVAAQEVVYQDPPPTWSVGVFPSQRVLAGVTREVLSDPFIRKHLRFRITETALRRGGVLCHFMMEAAQGSEALPQQKFVCLRLDAQLLPLLADPRRTWAWAELVQTIQHECPAATVEMVEEYLLSMCDGGLLIDSLQPPSLGKRPEQYLYDQSQVHPELAPLREVCRAMVELTDKPHALAAADFSSWWEKLEQHPWTASHRGGLGVNGAAARGNAYQAVLHINGSEGSISAALVGQLGRLLEACPGLWSHRQNLYRNAIAEYFAEGTVASRIPFLDLVYRVVKTPHFSKKARPGDYASRSSDLFSESLRNSLEQRMFEAERTGAAQIEITPLELQAWAESQGQPARLNPSPVVESLFQVIRRSGRSGIVHRHTTSLIGAYECRFLNWNNEHPMLQQLKDIWRLQAKLAAPALLAEVTASGPGFVKDLGQRPESYAHQIVLCGEASVPRAQQIPVHELSVYMGPNGPSLWWDRLGVQIIPRQHSSLNVNCYPAVVHVLLALDPYPTDWTLPPMPQSLPMRCARICHGDIVLRPQTWTLPAGLQTELLSGGKRHQKQRLQSLIAEWRERHQVPRYVRLGDADHNIVDLEQPLAMLELAEMLQDGLSCVCEEFLDEPPPVLGHQGPLLAEATAHIRLADESCGEPHQAMPSLQAFFAQSETALAPTFPISPQRELKLRQEHVFYPGGAWLYLKLYHGSGLGSETATRRFIDENLLGRFVAPLLFELEQEGVLKNYHFVRYSDPDAHLRLRMQATDGRGLALLDRIFERLTQEARSGAFAGYQVATYEREVDRYGGPDVLEAADQLFTADSRLCLSILAAYHMDLLDEETELQRLLPIRTLDTLFAAFGYGLADELAAVSRMRDFMQTPQLMTDPRRRELDGRYRRLSRIIQKQLRPPRADPLENSSPPNDGAEVDADASWLSRADVAAWYACYKAAVCEAAAVYRSAQENGRLQAAISDVLPVLFHMHCNRLLGSQELEFESIYLCQRALEAVQAQLKHRRQS